MRNIKYKKLFKQRLTVKVHVLDLFVPSLVDPTSQRTINKTDYKRKRQKGELFEKQGCMLFPSGYMIRAMCHRKKDHEWLNKKTKLQWKPLEIKRTKTRPIRIQKTFSSSSLIYSSHELKSLISLHLLIKVTGHFYIFFCLKCWIC